jgi:hypothetical protein
MSAPGTSVTRIGVSSKTLNRASNSLQIHQSKKSPQMLYSWLHEVYSNGDATLRIIREVDVVDDLNNTRAGTIEFLLNLEYSDDSIVSVHTNVFIDVLINNSIVYGPEIQLPAITSNSIIIRPSQSIKLRINESTNTYGVRIRFVSQNASSVPYKSNATVTVYNE